MKLTDKLVEKVGSDKLLHFLLTAWLVAEFKILGVIPTLIVFSIIIIVGILKERYMDVIPDYKDLKWSIYGGVTSLFLYILKLFI